MSKSELKVMLEALVIKAIGRLECPLNGNVLLTPEEVREYVDTCYDSGFDAGYDAGSEDVLTNVTEVGLWS